MVSTHSRPKAAGGRCKNAQSQNSGFNSQPPEGGWVAKLRRQAAAFLFQLTAARRRLAHFARARRLGEIGFNSQPPEGGWQRGRQKGGHRHRFNSQPPEGGWLNLGYRCATVKVSTHSRPKAAGESRKIDGRTNMTFQLTAARRRLAKLGAAG